MAKTKKLVENPVSNIAAVSTSGFLLHWENEQFFNPTKEYIKAIKAVMTAEIKMMREVHKDTIACWYCGSCEIMDLSNSRHFQFVYGTTEDVEWIKQQGQVFVEVPF